MKRKLKIGFTGTQKGMKFKQIEKLADFLSFIYLHVEEFHHGDCIGADNDFHNMTIVLSPPCEIVIHPPKNESKRAFCEGGIVLHKKEYLDRNHDIVDDTDCLIAATDGYEEKLRSGTWATIRYAIKKNKPVFIFYPDGTNKNLNYKEIIKKT